ncbi:MAG: GyrI-like domain-containing protein, partial [Gracilibacteraceae bacterium]|nr:GyrI-like domain-containing protein [Gracilibacteraceae bacterium]
MSELDQARERPNKLTDRDVRIVYLPPSAIAAYQFEGDEPEQYVSQVIDKFVLDNNLTQIKPDLRHYGFNAP